MDDGRFDVRVVTVAPGREQPFVEDDWQDALVILQAGTIELECARGGRRSFRSGSILWLQGLDLRILRNTGEEAARILAVSRKALPPS